VTLVPEGTPGASPVVVTALQMLDPAQLRPAPRPELAAAVVRHEPPDPALSRSCYLAVGEPWQWVDRRDWSAQQWADWVAGPGHELWTVSVDGELAGYAELRPDGAGSVEVAYFGLLLAYLGQGLGGWFLSEVLARAWAVPGTTRVWLHTCTLDGPAALPNYRARGLVAYEHWVEHRLVAGGG
jgi:RimJ/RimL family protein N-acetyltransferase